MVDKTAELEALIARQDPGIVEANLAALEQLADEELTYGQIRELTGITTTELSKRIKSGFDRSDKESIACLIEEYRPVLEDWPDRKYIAEVLEIDRVYSQGWHHDEILKGVTAVVTRRVQFKPSWVIQLLRKTLDYSGGYILSSEVEAILERDIDTITRNSALPYLQILGRNTLKLYPKSEVLKLKDKLDKSEGMLSARELAAALGIKLNIVYANVRASMKDPITGQRRYRRSLIKRKKNEVFVRYKSVDDVISPFEAEITWKGGSWARRVDRLVINGSIPSEKHRALHYLPEKSQEMIENIYGHVFMLREMGIHLLPIPESASAIGISANSLRVMLRKFGKCYGMTSPFIISNLLSTRQDNGSLVPVIPFVRLMPSVGVRNLTSVVVDALTHHVRRAEDYAEAYNRQPYNRLWQDRLAQSIAGINFS